MLHGILMVPIHEPDARYRLLAVNGPSSDCPDCQNCPNPGSIGKMGRLGWAVHCYSPASGMGSGAGQTKGFCPLWDVFSLASTGFLEHLTMPSRAPFDSGIGGLVNRVNWQIWDGKEDSSLFYRESIHFSPIWSVAAGQRHQQRLRKVENEVLVSGCGMISKVYF